MASLDGTNQPRQDNSNNPGHWGLACISPWRFATAAGQLVADASRGTTRERDHLRWHNSELLLRLYVTNCSDDRTPMALRMPEASSIFNNIRFATSDSAVWTLRIARRSRFDAGRLLVVPASPLPGLTTPRGKLKTHISFEQDRFCLAKEIIHIRLSASSWPVIPDQYCHRTANSEI
jgi:hypothetical protein